MSKNESACDERDTKSLERDVFIEKRTDSIHERERQTVSIAHNTTPEWYTHSLRPVYHLFVYVYVYMRACMYIRQAHEYERNARGNETRQQRLRARIVRVPRRLVEGKHEALGGTNWTPPRKEVYVFGDISDRRGGREGVRSCCSLNGRTSGNYQLPEVGLRRTNQRGRKCQ